MRQWGTSSDELLTISSSTLTNAFMVNVPQIVLSFSYLALNSICTTMASATEWNELARTRKGLRVTRPDGKQRSTYFLQLPYTWALPLMITSGILHWLLSQGFFLVRLDVIDRNNVVLREESKSAYGFSRLSFLIFLVITLVLACVIGSAGLRTMRQRIPFAASCSLVISAACHPPKDEQDPQLKEVKWGAVDEVDEEGFGHCSVTAREVKKGGLVRGKAYR
ncbi:hypothetical protein BCR34DRAFT_173420 [Clohesyomyces aquaticus]|uniref:Uncharacterized protein n=1 Tax=Clohesyomyces aquaticus TaxID=1231657 RepID=A0A1Y1YH62_9PLEO|nr:hypothetical protein BCR34DRAFT_173420 [Clohesyomyces aquaticus]